MLAAAVRLRDRLLGIADDPLDRPDERLRKQALILIARSITFPAVNVANRMESNAIPGRIQATQAVEPALVDEYLFEERGTIEVKGLGEMRTFFLLGRKPGA